MDTQINPQYENVNVLMEMFDAAKALAALNDVPVEGIVNQIILRNLALLWQIRFGLFSD